MSDPAPILLITNFPDRIGGGEESFIGLARGIDRARFTPLVLTPAEGEVAETLRADAAPVSILPMPPLRPWSAWGACRAIHGIRRLIRRHGIRLIHAHSSRAALYANLAAASLHLPTIWHARVAEPDPFLDPILLRLSTRVIAISHAVRSRFPPGPRLAKVRVVYNGIEPEAWLPVEEDSTAPEAPRLLLVGRLGAEKGQDTLIRAMPKVLHRHPYARAVFLGRGDADEASRLRRLSVDFGVDAAVEFHPWTAHPQPFYREAALVVLPSRSEGFGRTLVEAALVGRAVVASRVGGIPEVVADGETGLLVPADDPPALADALIALLGDYVLRRRLAADARTRALASFTIRRHVDAVQDVYAELLATTPARGV